jgi:hypothetical protein
MTNYDSTLINITVNFILSVFLSLDILTLCQYTINFNKMTYVFIIVTENLNEWHKPQNLFVFI